MLCKESYGLFMCGFDNILMKGIIIEYLYLSEIKVHY
jgi:hypothetical protein